MLTKCDITVSHCYQRPYNQVANSGHTTLRQENTLDSQLRPYDLEKIMGKPVVSARQQFIFLLSGLYIPDLVPLWTDPAPYKYVVSAACFHLAHLS